ncbi:hypothetical protein [Bordetella genomosp. 1]|nr:hypothetical protein [Bordetella genomosp. 1]MDQ8030546.1 hypothetical protein [Bordetella sp.]
MDVLASIAVGGAAAAGALVVGLASAGLMIWHALIDDGDES